MNKQNQTFEASMARLEQIVRAMERGDVALEESLKLFQEGTELVRNCQKLLDEERAACAEKYLAEMNASEAAWANTVCLSANVTGFIL